MHGAALALAGARKLPVQLGKDVLERRPLGNDVMDAAVCRGNEVVAADGGTDSRRDGLLAAAGIILEHEFPGAQAPLHSAVGFRDADHGPVKALEEIMCMNAGGTRHGLPLCPEYGFSGAQSKPISPGGPTGSYP